MIGNTLQNIYSVISNLPSEWKVAVFSAVFTSLISIWGIYFTIKHNEKMINLQLQSQKKEYEENKRLQIMPYIKYAFIDTKDNSQLSNGGFDFFPFGFINGGNGPAERFFKR